ncbi:MAG TPA: hypothetical protein VFE57_06415, partial [Cyclobacteriaceae bacterium]|nr:hypothetical protein [Cyclobacteriaceae bacterium]
VLKVSLRTKSELKKITYLPKLFIRPCKWAILLKDKINLREMAKHKVHLKDAIVSSPFHVYHNKKN